MNDQTTTRRLRITVRLLDNRFHGRTANDREPEWPPSPMRLFQAMVAGNKPRWNEPLAEAFEWFERLGVPDIFAPDATPGRPFTSYVPNNHRDANDDPAKRRVGKVVRPMLLAPGLCNPAIDYCWTILDDTWPDCESRAHQIILAARHIRAVGWGIDLAIGTGQIAINLAESVAGSQHWRPSAALNTTSKHLRIPTAGSLADLEEMHGELIDQLSEHGSLALARRPSVFRAVAYVCGHDLLPRPCVIFSLRDDADKRVSFRPQLVKHVVAILRHQINLIGQEAVERGDLDVATLEGVIMGHGKPPSTNRLTIAALPGIGHPKINGNISRVMIAEPPGSNGHLVEWLAATLPGRQLISEALKPVSTIQDSIFLGERTADPVSARYTTDRGRDWASVTPVILPGFDDRRRRKTVSLLQNAIAQAGIPDDAIDSIQPESVPFWAGSLHAREYDPPAYLQKYPRYHVRLRFNHEVAGPIAIGGGRYCGFGIFAAMDGVSSRS